MVAEKPSSLTSWRATRSAVKDFMTNKERRSAFLKGAKEFMAANAEGLKSQDNDGMKSQLKADKSFLKHANAIGLGLLGYSAFSLVRAWRTRSASLLAYAAVASA